MSTVLFLCVASALAQPAWRYRNLPEPDSLDEAEITVSFQETALPDALKQLSDQSGYLFRAAPELGEKTVTLQSTGKPFRVLVMVAAHVQAAPRPAVFLVPEDRVPTKQPKFDLPDRKITVGLPEMETATVLAVVSTSAQLKVLADEAVIEKMPKLAVDFKEAAVEDVLNGLAEKLGAKWVRGLYLEPVDPEAEFERFMQMAPEEQEQVLREAARRMQGVAPSPEEVAQGMQRAIDEFFKMPREDRQRIIQRIAGGLNRFADRFAQFSPEGQQELMAAIGPYVRAGIGVYLRLPASQQAELAPLVQAVSKLPLGR
ncbi:MAG: hypothetical protein N2512_08315 [Armatimonadetes bacterium]|nr:hypothetical protein [Armatimonadota bacterium]